MGAFTGDIRQFSERSKEPKMKNLIGQSVEFTNGTKWPVIPCEKCGEQMINLDASDILPGALKQLKDAGVLVSNPGTTEDICIHCDLEHRPSKRKALSSWYHSSSNDDSPFFGGGSSSGSSSDSSSGGFGSGGFGGFGGGGFSGGGASGSW